MAVDERVRKCFGRTRKAHISISPWRTLQHPQHRTPPPRRRPSLRSFPRPTWTRLPARPRRSSPVRSILGGSRVQERRDARACLGRWRARAPRPRTTGGCRRATARSGLRGCGRREPRLLPTVGGLDWSASPFRERATIRSVPFPQREAPRAGRCGAVWDTCRCRPIAARGAVDAA